MKKLFWKTYRVEFTTEDRKYYNVQFFRGFTWEVITMALKEAKRKSEKENTKWAVWNITRI